MCTGEGARPVYNGIDHFGNSCYDKTLGKPPLDIVIWDNQCHQCAQSSRVSAFSLLICGVVFHSQAVMLLFCLQDLFLLGATAIEDKLQEVSLWLLY